MMPKPAKSELFEEFKNSFSYGSRTDLNFKFLAKLSDVQAAKFLQELLQKLGDAFDDGNFRRLIQHTYDWQRMAYAGSEIKFTYHDGSFTLLSKPVSESRLLLLTSSGHFVEGDDPKPLWALNMTQEEATARVEEFLKEAPQLSSIPIETTKERLCVRHGGYDISGAQADPNVVFPVESLCELMQEGAIGEIAAQAYSFVGACSQKRLLNRTAPQWVEIFKQQHIDAVLLVPV